MYPNSLCNTVSIAIRIWVNNILCDSVYFYSSELCFLTLTAYAHFLIFIVNKDMQF